jgi:hypothetical protein
VSRAVWLEGLGLEGFPVAALAAYGVLRLLVEEEGMGEVRLVFRNPFSRPVPGLLGVEERELLLHLARRLRRTPPLPQQLLDQKKELEDLLEEMQGLAAADPRTRIFLPALLLPRPGGEIFRSPLDTSKASQYLTETLRKNWEAARRIHLLKGLRQVLFADSPRTGVLLEKGVKWQIRFMEKGKRKRGFGQMGWHPTQYRRRAEGAQKPSELEDKEKVRIHPVATLLAWEAVPLFFLYPTQDGIRAAGIHDPEGSPRLLLPTPDHPVSLRALKALLLQAPLALQNPRAWPPEVALWCSDRLGHPKKTNEPHPVYLEAQPAPCGPQAVTQTPGGSRRWG